jgi:hypothetical protein
VCGGSQDRISTLQRFSTSVTFERVNIIPYQIFMKKYQIIISPIPNLYQKYQKYQIVSKNIKILLNVYQIMVNCTKLCIKNTKKKYLYQILIKNIPNSNEKRTKMSVIHQHSAIVSPPVLSR